MKVLIKVLSIFAPLIMGVSCVTTSGALPEKYRLDSDLEAVEQINKFRVSGWEQVDSQSVILRANINEYYLLVLERPITTMISGISIGISGTSFTITPGYDKIFVKDSGGIEHYVIARIYRFKDKDQVSEIRERLRKKSVD